MALSAADRRYRRASRSESRATAASPHIPTSFRIPSTTRFWYRAPRRIAEQIKNLLRQLDDPPRQVLIDAKIYELDLTGAFAAGVSAYLDKKDTGADLAAR